MIRTEHCGVIVPKETLLDCVLKVVGLRLTSGLLVPMGTTLEEGL